MIVNNEIKDLKNLCSLIITYYIRLLLKQKLLKIEMLKFIFYKDYKFEQKLR